MSEPAKVTFFSLHSIPDVEAQAYPLNQQRREFPSKVHLKSTLHPQHTKLLKIYSLKEIIIVFGIHTYASLQRASIGRIQSEYTKPTLGCGQ